MQFLGDIGGFQSTTYMLGFIANFLLLSRSPAATIYETLFKQSKDKSKSKVAPIKNEDKENWLRKMEKPKINAFEHLGIGNFLLYLVIYFFRTDKQKKFYDKMAQ